MSERPTPETDKNALLLANLDDWIDDCLRNSKPIGLTLCDARKRISDQSDRIAELWDAMEIIRRERDEALSDLEFRRGLYKVLEEANSRLVASNKEAVALARTLKQERDEARDKYATEATEHMLAINKICNESKKAREELANIESLMFGGLVQFTPKDGIAWRVFDAVMELKKERDEAREEWGKSSMDAAQLLSEKTKIMAERDELQDILRKLLEIIPEPECHDFGHTKEERHAFLEECPVMARYDALIAQAKEALK